MAVAAPFRLIAALLIALAGCDIPRDAEGTLQRVRAEGVLTVGYSERPPWVIASGATPTGAEPRLIALWAGELDAAVRWVRGSEASLLRALEQRQIDLMVGGLTDDLGWIRQAAPSQPFYEARLVVAVPSSQDDLRSRPHWRGQSIGYPATRPDFAARIAEAGALPQAIEIPGEAPVALYDFEAAQLGLVASPGELASERLVMLVAPGESAFLLALDRFLAGARRRGLVAEAVEP